MLFEYKYDTPIRTTALVLTGATMLSFIALTSISSASADTTATANASINVLSACTMSSGGGDYSQTVVNGSTTTITANSIVSSCNDHGGFKIYAIGDSDNVLGNTDMISSISNNYNIKTDGTGTYNSYWKMKIDNTSGAGINATIPSGYASYTTIPNEFALVATYNSSTGNSTGSITPSYQIYIADDQPAGTYTGKVRYTLVHPNTEPAPTKTQLYQIIANMSKGKQTAADLKVAITTPTSSDPATDTSNSGVYEYDSSVFGISSDASNDYAIYYYRGILDNSFANSDSYGDIGSSGDGTLYPNYVLLDADGAKDTNDTCWRIVRTTGSGGVKMIYNGLWTGSTCAHQTNGTRVVNRSYASSSGSGSSSNYWYRNINLVGYTFNNDPNIQDSTNPTSVDTVFGNNSNYNEINTSSSSVKKYLENTWFSTIADFESNLETSAGYCNNRTAYLDGKYISANPTPIDVVSPFENTTPLSNNIVFGSAYRTKLESSNPIKELRTPSLKCSQSRNIVDLYTVSGSTNGNGQLKKPVALLTADEASFSGAQNWDNQKTPKCFLRSGNEFFTLSPGFRHYTSAGAYTMNYLAGGSIGINMGVSADKDVRPVISLKAGTTVTSGSGTAADPWVITAPSP